MLIEWSPLIIFFISFKLFGIYWATFSLLLACVVPLLWHRARTGKFKPLHLITLGVVAVLGGATLLLHDKRFIQWKPTVLLGLAAAAFLGSALSGKQPLVKRLLNSAFERPLPLTPSAWRWLGVAWSAWFALLAGLNLYVAHHFNEATWVNFKLFGISAAMLVFMLPQFLWLNAKIESAAPQTAPPGSDR